MDTPQECLQCMRSTNNTLRFFSAPRPASTASPATSIPAPSATNNKSYAAAVHNKPTHQHPLPAQSSHINALEKSIAIFSKQSQAQLIQLATLTENIEKLQTKLDQALSRKSSGSVKATARPDKQHNVDDISATMRKGFDLQQRSLGEVLRGELARSVTFTPLLSPELTGEWGKLLAACILYHLHEPHTELAEQARNELIDKFLETPHNTSWLAFLILRRCTPMTLFHHSAGQILRIMTMKMMMMMIPRSNQLQPLQ